MRIKDYRVLHDGKVFIVECTSKKITSIRLRVLLSGQIRLSVPYSTPEPLIQAFLDHRAGWLALAVSRMQEHKIRAANGKGSATLPKSVRLLGKDFDIRVLPGNGESLIMEDGKIIIYTRKPDDEAKVARQLCRWIAQEARMHFEGSLDTLYPVLAALGHDKPELVIRNMRATWGSCNIKKKRITLSLRLFFERPEFIDYIVFHELAHLEHPDHQAGFKAFLTANMPDWRARRQLASRRRVRASD
jgi:predicted metal-dependent hydrolase